MPFIDHPTPVVLPPEVAEVVRRVVARVAPEQVILFGSWARGEATADSDLDLLIVADIPRSQRRQRVIDVERALVGISLPTDVVILSRDDLTAQAAMLGTLARPALQEGRILYDRAA